MDTENTMICNVYDILPVYRTNDCLNVFLMGKPIHFWTLLNISFLVLIKCKLHQKAKSYAQYKKIDFTPISLHKVPICYENERTN